MLQPYSPRLFSPALALCVAVVLALVMAAPSRAHAAPQPPPGHDLQAQIRFEEAVQAAILKLPHGVIDYSWHANGGQLIVTPRFEHAARDLVTSMDAPVTVGLAAPDAIPFVERAEFERAALDHFMGLANSMGARYDPASNTIIVTLRPNDRAAISERVRQVLSAHRPVTGPDIVVEYDDPSSGMQLQADVIGGEAYHGCTGGFIGNGASGWGIITAEHCRTKPSTYDGATTGTSYHAGGSDIDLRFTKLSGGTPRNKFRSSSSGVTTITSLGTLAVGGWLYKYGKVTGVDGVTIAEYRGCEYLSFGAYYYCYLYRSDGVVTVPGDSGGPWYTANRGYGLTTGSMSSSTGPTGSLITPIAYVYTIAGTSVTVKLN